MQPVNEALASAEPWSTIAALVIGYFLPKLIDLAKAKFGSKGGAAVPKLLDALKDRIKVAQPGADPDQVVAKIITREIGYGIECNPPPPAKDSAQLAG